MWLRISIGIAGIALAVASDPGTGEADMGPHLDPRHNNHNNHKMAAQPTGAALLDLRLEVSLEARSGLGKGLGHHLTETATLWSNELGGHVNQLTLDLVDVDFDMRQGRANVRVGTLADAVGLRVVGNIKLRSNVARVQPSLAIGLRGETYQLRLPTFEVATQDVAGERSVELRLPLLEGTF